MNFQKQSVLSLTHSEITSGMYNWWKGVQAFPWWVNFTILYHGDGFTALVPDSGSHLPWDVQHPAEEKHTLIWRLRLQSWELIVALKKSGASKGGIGWEMSHLLVSCLRGVVTVPCVTSDCWRGFQWSLLHYHSFSIFGVFSPAVQLRFPSDHHNHNRKGPKPSLVTSDRMWANIFQRSFLSFFPSI